jgi:hypothetical protein
MPTREGRAPTARPNNTRASCIVRPIRRPRVRQCFSECCEIAGKNCFVLKRVECDLNPIAPGQQKARWSRIFRYWAGSTALRDLPLKSHFENLLVTTIPCSPLTCHREVSSSSPSRPMFLRQPIRGSAKPILCGGLGAHYPDKMAARNYRTISGIGKSSYGCNIVGRCR